MFDFPLEVTKNSDGTKLHGDIRNSSINEPIAFLSKRGYVHGILLKKRNQGAGKMVTRFG